MSEWQPIATAPPKRWSEIIAFDGYSVLHVYLHPDGEWVRTNLGPEDEDSIINPTHWMPLPEPPE